MKSFYAISKVERLSYALSFVEIRAWFAMHFTVLKRRQLISLRDIEGLHTKQVLLRIVMQ
jgi:hypothetical protein